MSGAAAPDLIERRLDRPVPGSRLRARLGRSILLVASDAIAVALSGVLAYWSWAAPVRHQPADLYLRLWPLLALFLVAYWRNGLYPGFGLGGVEILRRLSLGTSFVFLFLAGLDFVFKLPQVYSRMTVALAWSFALMLVPLGRLGLLSAARRWRWWGEPCVVLGTGPVAEHTIASLHRALTLGFRPVGVLTGSPDGAPGAVQGTPILGPAELAPTLADQGVRVAVMVDGPGEEWTSDLLARLQTTFRTVLWVHKGGDLPTEGVALKNLGGVVGVEYVNQLLLLRSRVMKRALDLVLGTVLAVLATPVLLLSAVAVKLSSRGPILYSQAREGLGGRMIRVWKLRTMHVDAESRLERTLAADPALRREWETRFKLDPDPRVVPRVGTFLRRFSLDELPQLWQVVAGTLSLVGPRPFPAYHLEHFDSVILRLRRRVRPGLTGLWQVKVRSRGGLEEQQSHDAYYIRNWSLWMDLYVLVRTFAVVLTRRGAV